MNSNSAAILVPPPTPAGLTNDIRAIKPPVEVPNEWAWLWWTLAGLLVAAAIMAALIWFLKKRAQAPAIPIIPPHVRAKQRLHAALSLIHDPRLFCIEVSSITRVYLEERFNFHAPERTTYSRTLRSGPTVLVVLVAIQCDRIVATQSCRYVVKQRCRQHLSILADLGVHIVYDRDTYSMDDPTLPERVWGRLKDIKSK